MSNQYTPSRLNDPTLREGKTAHLTPEEIRAIQERIKHKRSRRAQTSECLACTETFVVKRPWQKFCSQRCSADFHAALVEMNDAKSMEDKS